MASSSVSQESLDMEDFEMTRQRNRIRTHRGRGMLHRAGERDAGDGEGRDQNGDGGDGPAAGFQDHDSPTRTAARAKDKRTRPNHMHKGKLPKDKRKLREKRRSTGVVHLQSTESTGDSLDDDDEEDKVLMETKKNTVFNELTEKNKANHEPHSHHHSSYQHHTHHSHSGYTARRNKSPSDLEADLEDNQDYDSTVSHSETNLTLIGRSESSDTQISLSHLSRPAAISKFTRYSPETAAASFSHSTVPTLSDPESNKTNSTSSSTYCSPATSTSVLSRYVDRSRDSENVTKDADRAGVGKFRDSNKSTENTYSSYSNRFRGREDSSSPVQSHVQTRISAYPGAKPVVTQQNEYTSNVEKQLEKEKEENKRLKQMLEEKDRRIAELEREVSLLNKHY
ncbi:putative protein TPRXL isoform X2 [Gigantopelta aegis]|uniref:putative protein TPRXL isoform X2 n=1 Tax=Gigantopelta aegis TaxID=1735272 RepID=UPI001B88CE1E|nr:putative protein TPRXL isoform X2 [Gigantopelta aegis]